MSKPSKQQLHALAKTVVEDLKKYEHHKGWQKYQEKPCLMERMEIGQGMATRSTAVVHHTPKQILKFLTSGEALKKVNPTCIEEKLLLDELEFKVTYLRYSAPWPVSHRDFVSVKYQLEEGPNKIYIGSRACKFPHPEEKGVVRGQVIIGGYILQAINEKQTKITYIACVDIKGSIPGMVKNELSKKEGEVASKVGAAMKQALK